MAPLFLGRSHELKSLERLSHESRVSLVTLWGPGGVGKTRLAREHAAAARARGRVIAWADLAAARSRSEVVIAIAAALGVTLTGTEEAGVDTDALASAAHAQRALVVADNLEQLDDDASAAVLQLAAAIHARRAEALPTRAPDLAAAAPAMRNACVLATSRERLGGPHEMTIAVAPLAEDDGIALFEALAGGTRDPKHEVARAIVRRLDSLPLALELAAARVPLLGAPELLARLDRKLDVLAGAADRPARHATLRATIAWSWEQLDDGERSALMACATFEAPFDAALAEAVIGGAEAVALDRLESLRGRALVHASTDAVGRTTLRLLESVRDFAREASESHDATNVVSLRGRHGAAVVARAEPIAEAARCGRDTLKALEALRADLALAAHTSGSIALRAALALSALFAISGPAAAAVECVDAALDAQARAPSDDVSLLIVRLLVAKGDAWRALGRPNDARDVLERAATAARALGEGRDAVLASAEAARVLGSVLRSLGRVEEASARQEQALAIYRVLGDRAREGICLGELGAVHQSEGRLSLARRCHAEAIASRRHGKPARRGGRALVSRGGHASRRRSGRLLAASRGRARDSS